MDWRPWSAEAFEAARREDKPVFLSIGYSTCHWCHVMAHESFEDNEVAAVLNRDFIPVKVDGEAAHPAKLEDFAFLAWGLLELYAVTFRTSFLAEACALGECLLTKFFDRERGGFYPYASDGEQLITRTKEAYDGALPSGNAVAALVLSRLARLTGGQCWRNACERQLRYLAGTAKEHPAGHSFTMLTLLEELWPSEELICTAQELPRELVPFLRRPRLNRTALLKTPKNAEALARVAPFTAAYPLPAAGAQYYLCRTGAGEAPVSSLSELT